MPHPTQQIRFCTSRDGVRIAYAVCGSGPPLVVGGHYLSHLEFDWDSPVWRPWLDMLSRRHTLIRYDHRGCGLSDREGIEFSLEKFIEDFAAVADAAQINQFAVFGLAGGATTGMLYASSHPERVDRLVLFGSNAQGRFVRAKTDELRQEAETQLNAIELGWPNDNPAFRQLFTSLIIPDGTTEHFRSFNDQIRRTAPPGNAAKIMRTFYNADHSLDAAKVRCPTLIFHSREDARIPFEQGRMLARLIPDARLVPLDSRNHLIMESEPAWQHFIDALDDFLPATAQTGTVDHPVQALDDLSPRESEVLELVAQGLDNATIGGRLGISERTVRNHLSTILSKLGVNSRSQAIVRARDAGLGQKPLK
jgi:pimeloyl-ACP methyl ester carboxylesterase/DNA-binding CsgD family transcriptional regulator